MENYHSMKRKELQALCKKHNIPAGSANSVLADKLSQLLNVQEKQKLITRQQACLKSQVETTDDGEPEVSKREAKKVTFSSTNVLAEYERSVNKLQDVVRETGPQRKPVAKKMGKPVVDIDNRVELVDDTGQIPVRLTRSRVHILEKDDAVPNVGNRQGRSAVKDVVKGKDASEEPKANAGKAMRSKVHGLGKCGAVQLDENKQSKMPVKGDAKANKSDEEPMVVHARVTRLKAQTSMDAGMDPDVKPLVKKKSGRQATKVAQLAGLAKEVVDIPVRTTRTRGQALKEDTENTVTKPQAEKKRTRRQMEATDRSSNSSNVALEDNEELPQRKSLRTREVKDEDEDEAGKVQMVDNRRVRRSRVTSSKSKTENKVEAQRKSKRVQQLEEPLERAVKKNVKRRESAMQPVKIEVVLHLEEPVNALAARVTRRKSIMQKAQGKGIDPEKTDVVLHHEEPVSGPAGRITRRKSLMQKAQSKATDKPSVGKSQPVNEMEIPNSPKTVVRRQLKRQSGSLSMIGEGLKDKENAIMSGKDAFEDKMKAVVNSTISLKSKKRRGTLLIEDGPVEAEYVSPIECSRRSMRSASKSEGKAVSHPLQNFAKTQLKSGLKTSSTGGTVVKDGSSKKRAILSVMKQTKLEDHGEMSNIDRTPISKLVTFEFGERVTENEHTPAIDGYSRRFTRSAIGSNKKESRQSAVKVQPVGDVQLSSHKVPKSRHDSAVKTAPGRVTRSGVKHAGNIARGLSERVDKKQQQCDSAYQRKPFDEFQMSSHEAAESRCIPDVTIGAQSEMPKEVIHQILEHDISASESARLPAELAKESKSETAITLDAAESVLKSGIPGAYGMELANIGSTSKGQQSYVGVEEPVVSVCMTVGMEESTDLFGDGNFTCHSVPYSLAFEQPCIESKSEGDKETVQAKEGERGSSQKQVMQEPVSEDNNVHGIIEKLQSSDMANREVSDGELDGETNKDDTQLTAGDELVGLSVDEDGTKDDIVTAHDSLAKQNKLSLGKNISFGLGMHMQGVANDTVKEPMQGLELEAVPSTIDVCEVPISGKSDGVSGNMPSHGEDHVPSSVEGEDEADKANSEYESNPKPKTDVNVSRLSEPMTDLSSVKDIHETPLSGKDSSFGLATERHGVEDILVDAEVASTANDVHKMLSLGKPDGVDDDDNTYKEHESNSKPLINDGVSDTPVLGKDDYSNIAKLFESTLYPSSANDIVETPISGDDTCSDIAIDRSGVADTGKEHAHAHAHEFELAPSAGNDVQEMFSLGESDSANATKECEADTVPSTGGNMPSDGDHPVLCGGDVEDQAYDSNKEHELKLKRLTDDDVSDTTVLGKDDDYNITRLCETTSDPSTNDIVETPFSVDDIFGDSDNAIYDQKSPLKPITDIDDVEDDVINGSKELVSGLEPSVTSYSPNVPLLGNNADRNEQDREPEHEKITRIDMCAMGEQFVGGASSKPDQNENTHVVTKDLIGSTMAVDAHEVSSQDTDKDAVSDYFGDIYGLETAVGVTDTENDNWREQKVTRTSEPDESAFSKGSDSIYPDINPEQITEDAELTTKSDHALSDKKERLGTSIEHNLGSDKSMEDCSNSAVEVLDSQLVGDLKVQETPTREEIPGGDTLSDAPTSLMEDIGHKQEKTQKENMFMDWGSYSVRMDGFQKLVSTNKNDNSLAKSTKDDQVSDLQSSAEASSSIHEISNLAVDFVNSANKLEHSSRNVTDRESDQDANLLKGNVKMLEEVFNWSDLSLKSFLTTPAATRNDFKGENTRGNASGQENEMCGVLNFEHFPNKYFEDEEVDGSASTGSRIESSGLNVSSTLSGVLGEKETQLKGSEIGDNLASDKGT